MNELDLEGFERYCKNIFFINSISMYKTYLKEGVKILKKISSDTIETFVKKINEDNQYLKKDFQSYDELLYSNFKSAAKKYLGFLNNEYPLNKKEIQLRYHEVYNNIQNNGLIKLKTHNNSLFTLETNTTSLCVKGDDGKGQECMSISLDKILRILFENEKYTYPSYEPSVINFLFNLIEEEVKKQITIEQENFYKSLAKEFGLTNRTPHLSSGRHYFQIYPKNAPVSEGVGGTHYEFVINGQDIDLALHLENRIKDRVGLKQYLNVKKPSSPKREFSKIVVTNMTEDEIRLNFKKLYNQYEDKINEFYLSRDYSNEELQMQQSHNKMSLNQILYGPPGTGKTHKLEKEYFNLFTESFQTQSKPEFLLDLVKGATWWQIIAAILLEKNGLSVNEIYEHELFQYKYKTSNTKSAKQTIWAQLQIHTKEECEFVKYKNKSLPYIFDKSKDGIWTIDNSIIKNEASEVIELF